MVENKGVESAVITFEVGVIQYHLLERGQSRGKHLR